MINFVLNLVVNMFVFENSNNFGSKLPIYYKYLASSMNVFCSYDDELKVEYKEKIESHVGRKLVSY